MRSALDLSVSAARLPARLASRLPLSGPALAAIATFALAMAAYLLTMLPGPSVGDWAEMQWLPARLGVPHPTGYPLYVMLGWLFSLVPFGTLGWRAELLSAASAAAASATCVLIASRLGVRTIIAFAAGLALAVTGELWLEATFSEMNSLHLFLMAATIHRALVWRAERRDRDVQLGALLAGLGLSNHVLAATVVPFLVVFVVAVGRDRFRARPLLFVRSAALVLVGLLLYLFIPIRAQFGPTAVYASLETWDGFSRLVTGADLRGQMHFTLGEGIAKAWADIPSVLGQFVERSNVVFVAGGLVGGAIQLVRDRAVALTFLAIVAVNLYVFANYVGDLDHYLLITWLILAIWLAVAAETVAGWLERRLPRRAHVPGAAIVAVGIAVSIIVANWATYDESANRDGASFADAVFDALPRDAVLVSYWDALTTLGYEHCAYGRRPDVALRALDPAARIVCDPADEPLEIVARTRPVYALFAAEGELGAFHGSFDLRPGPRLAVPYGKRGLDHDATLYRLVPKSP